MEQLTLPMEIVDETIHITLHGTSCLGLKLDLDTVLSRCLCFDSGDAAAEVDEVGSIVAAYHRALITWLEERAEYMGMAVTRTEVGADLIPLWDWKAAADEVAKVISAEGYFGFRDGEELRLSIPVPTALEAVKAHLHYYSVVTPAYGIGTDFDRIFSRYAAY